MCISDTENVDLKTCTPDDSIKSYLKRSKHNAILVKQMASKDFDRGLLKDRFPSHVFAESIQAVEMKPLASKEEIGVWKQALPLCNKFVMLKIIRHKSLNVEKLFEEPSDKLHHHMFKTSNDSTLMDFIVGESKVNQLSADSMKMLREDSNAISQHEGLSVAVTNHVGGLLDNEMMDSRQILGPYLQELNVIHTLLKEDGKQPSEIPLFKSYAEMEEYMEKYEITFCPPKRLTYYKEIQNRSRPISLMKKVLQNTASEEEINYEARICPFFNQMKNKKESFFLKNDFLRRTIAVC